MTGPPGRHIKRAGSSEVSPTPSHDSTGVLRYGKRIDPRGGIAASCMNQSKHVQLLDTTLRDGEQTRHVSFSTSEKVTIAEALLGSLKVDRIEVASAGISEGEREAVSRIAEWAKREGCLDRVEVLGFVDGSRSADWLSARASG
jgi:hypothetical protein